MSAQAKLMARAADNLGQFEQLVLASVFVLGRGHAVPIRDKMEEFSTRRIHMGPVYATLERLQDKGYLSSYLSDAASRRTRRYYRIEDEGEQMLVQAMRINRRVMAAVLAKRDI